MAAQQNGTTSTTAPAPTAEKPALPQLGALEEDDEFEEFIAEDWDASESDLSHLIKGGKVTGTGVDIPEDKKITNDNLWQDNWDDDDIEDDFSKQLRAAIADSSKMQA